MRVYGQMLFGKHVTIYSFDFTHMGFTKSYLSWYEQYEYPLNLLNIFIHIFFASIIGTCISSIHKHFQGYKISQNYMNLTIAFLTSTLTEGLELLLLESMCYTIKFVELYFVEYFYPLKITSSKDILKNSVTTCIGIGKNFNSTE